MVHVFVFAFVIVLVLGALLQPGRGVTGASELYNAVSRGDVGYLRTAFSTEALKEANLPSLTESDYDDRLPIHVASR